MENKGSFLNDLAVHIFQAPGRWGWEYREPAPARAYPHLDAEPLWYEPAGSPGAGPAGSPSWGAGPPAPPSPPAGSGVAVPSVADLERRAKMPARIGICVVLAFVGVLVIKHGGVILVLAALVMACVWFLPLLATSSGPAAARAGAERDRAWAHYSQDWQAWRTKVQNWDAGEKARITGDNLWYPVIAADRTSRIDVFGGVPDGWAALATTMGASTLKNGDSILVLDLTEHDISRELLDLARVLEQPSHSWELPAELAQANVLLGLEAEDVAEIMAEAVHSTRESGSADLRGLDADLIRAVAQRLDGDVTFRKLSAGLQVLRRSYDDALGQAPVLSATELQRLAAYVDAAGQDDQTQQELKLLAGNIDLLTTAEAEAPGSQDPGFWRTGILVMRTADRNPRRKDFMDRVLAQTVIHHLRSRPASGSGDVLFVAGCDHLGLRTLENLTRQARRSGLQTVLILEHLRDDIQKLLGGSDSASLIMRMGNAQEAAAAAEFIGRGHTFVLNQLTRQLSDAATDGESKQWGASGTVSDTDSSSGGAGFGWSRSRGISRADSWSRTVNWSTTKTQTDGVTSTRVYEFAIEPVEIQSMPLTAFMFVEAADGRRRVVAGDCNPGISMLDRVARRPQLTPRTPAPPSAPIALTGQPVPSLPPGLEPGSRW